MSEKNLNDLEEGKEYMCSGNDFLCLVTIKEGEVYVADTDRRLEQDKLKSAKFYEGGLGITFARGK